MKLKVLSMDSMEGIIINARMDGGIPTYWIIYGSSFLSRVPVGIYQFWWLAHYANHIHTVYVIQ